MTGDHDDLAGQWRIEEGQTPAGDPYTGTLEIAPEGEAWRLRWTMPGDDGAVTSLGGVGLISDGTLYASWAARPPDDPDGARCPGIVHYQRGAPGELLACWYHPSLAGSLGVGRSSGGPRTGLASRYRADYAGGGTAFETLRKDVCVLGDHLAITWAQGDAVLFGGVAAQLSDATLASAWAQPSRMDLHLLAYPLDARPVLSAAWVDGVAPVGTGLERAIRMS